MTSYEPGTASPTKKRLISKRASWFDSMLRSLPPSVQENAVKLFKLFKEDPLHPMLETKALYDSRRGRHRKNSFAVRLSLRYRAIYVIDNGEHGDEPEQAFWYWVGSREDYANFVGAR